MKRHAQTDLNYWLKSPDRRPLVIRGARQVGKSTLVRMFAADAKLDLIEINLERHLHLDQVFATLDIDLMVRAIEDTAGKALGPSSLLFLDEIQATPNALGALRYFYEDRRELAVIAAGSLLELALPDIESSMPVGRIDYRHLGPLTLVEYLQAQSEDLVLERLVTYKLGAPWSDALHERLTKLLATYMQVGGMPEPLASYIDTPNDTRRWMIAQQRIVDTYQDDFNKYKKRGESVPILQELYRRLPGKLGRKIKYTELAPGFRVEKIRQALDMLAAARIIYKAPHASPPLMPLSAHASQKVFKIYWLDIGLLVRTVGSVPKNVLSNVEGAPAFQGIMAEQFVAQHLAYLGASHRSPELYYWLREGKTDNAEVDFLAPLPVGAQQQVLPIEVKFGAVAKILSLKQYLHAYRPELALRLYQAPPKVEQLGRHQSGFTTLYMTPFLTQILGVSGES